MQLKIILVIILLLASHLSKASDGICPDSIIVFRHNDLEIEMMVEGAEEELSVIWDFGNGEIAEAGSNITHVFTEGVFNVSATFMDEDCGSDSITITTRIEISACWLSLSYVELKNGLYTFTAEGYPEKYPMFWEMGDGTFIVETWVVDHQYDPGTYEVCAYIVSDFCYVDTLEACVTLTYEIPDHLKEEQKAEYFVYPNPSQGVIHFNFNPLFIEMYGIDGRLILSERHTSACLSINELESGLYWIRAKTESGDEFKDLIQVVK